MIGNRIVLDTSVVIDLFKGDKEVASFLSKQQEIYMPFAVLGELYLGAHRSACEKKHLQDIKDFLVECNILSADAVTAEKYAILKAALLKKGTPIPENDIWIAATAIQHDLPLYTTDKHFDLIDGLTLVNKYAT